VRGLLREHGFKIGISIWHFFGDGQIKEGELDLGIYHPHLNCLVVGRWISDVELKKAKDAWKSYLEKLVGYRIEDVDIWYQYYKEKGQWYHKGRYITRPTFKSLEGDNFFLAGGLFNFRNVVYWGWGQKEEREEKRVLGLMVLTNWFAELNAKEESEREEVDLTLSILSGMLCPRCFALDSKIVKLVAKPDFVFLYEELKVRGLIQKEYDSGFLLLHPWFCPSLVILNLKPMISDWFVDFSFDTS
jgi:hypothetical protein